MNITWLSIMGFLIPKSTLARSLGGSTLYLEQGEVYEYDYIIHYGNS